MRFFVIAKDGHSWLGSYDPFTTPKEVENAYGKLTGKKLTDFKKICRELPSAKEFLHTHAAEYGWDGRLLKLGRTMHPKKLPTPVPYFNPPWTCYENSFKHAKKHGLLYVEGLAINPSGAYIHAWNSTDGTDVIDYTWPYQHVNNYFGIVMSVEWVENHSPIPGGMLGYLHEETSEGRANPLFRALVEKFITDHTSEPAP